MKCTYCSRENKSLEEKGFEWVCETCLKKKGCRKDLCSVKGCMWCVCGGTDNKGKLMLCSECNEKIKKLKKETKEDDGVGK